MDLSELFEHLDRSQCQIAPPFPDCPFTACRLGQYDAHSAVARARPLVGLSRAAPQVGPSGAARRFSVRGWVGGRLLSYGMVLLAGLTLAMPVSWATAAVAGASQTWQIQNSPNGTVPSGQIQAVSCPLASTCTAVGYYLDSAGLVTPLAETWNGTSWKQQAAPRPVGAPAPGLNGVSCVSASFCEAVGISNEPKSLGDTGFAEMWNGSSWSLQPVPSPAGATTVVLTAVSCVSTSFCEAVGSYLNSSHAIVSLGEEWNGTAWTLQSTPNQSGSAPTELEGVSCVSAHFCEAVDFYGALAEEWNGTSWTAHFVPIPSGATSPDLYAVSCISTKFCEAVGTYVDPNSSDSLILLAEMWNGTSWREQSVPSSASWKLLTGVSCVLADFCEAVGYKEAITAGGDTFRPIAEVWNGTSWQAQSAPSAGGTALAELVAVSCADASACEAGGALPVRMEVWNGSSWATQHAVVPRGATNNNLGGVSCVTATFCEAVGYMAGRPAALPEVWNGSTWKIQPRAVSLPLLAAVSCVSATLCEAVGSGFANSGIAAAGWNGTSWQPQITPGLGYSAVSCTSPSFCVAVGLSGGAMWNGTSWSAESLPLPSSGGTYTGVSCVSTNACEAVGRATIGGAFAAGWNGTSWTAQAVPGPPGATRAMLGKVSCTLANACEAVGASNLGGYAAAWNGTAWTAQAVAPLPPGAARDFLTDVACTSSSACTAVGYSMGSASPYARLTLAETWNGTSWSIQPTPNPAATGNVLEGVSCASAGPCVAVGSAPDPGGYSATLVEATG
jgi:hypothetical protein